MRRANSVGAFPTSRAPSSPIPAIQCAVRHLCHREDLIMRSTTAAMRKPKQVSELERARVLGLVGAVKGGPRDVAERHSEYLKAKLRRATRRTR